MRDKADRRSLLLILALGLAAQATSLTNQFAYDDVHVILGNEAVHSLGNIPGFFSETYWPAVSLGPGGRLYRPMAITGYAVQWALGNGSPWIFHLVSLLGALLVAALVFACARRFLPSGPSALAGAFFAVHPVHAEAVANVVGQAEIFAAAWVLLAVILYLDGRRDGLSSGRVGAIALCYFAACLTKEHAVILPALLLCLEPLIQRERWRSVTPAQRLQPILLLGLVGIIFLAIRGGVVGPGSGDAPHPLWQQASLGQRGLTMLGLVPRVGRLFLWPWHLQADYSPREVLLASGWGMAQLLGLVVLLLLTTVALGSVRRHPMITAGLLWLAVALLPAANLLIPTGVVLAERTLYLPSVGIALVLAGAAARMARHAEEGPRLVFGAVAWTWLLLGAGRSALRQPVWRDNQTLFQQTIRDAPQSYMAWRGWGGQLVLEQRLPEAEAAYRRSLSLFDRDPNVMDELAGILRRESRCEESVPLMRQALQLDPARYQTASRLVGCLTTLGRYAEARDEIHRHSAAGHPELDGLLRLVDSVEAAR